jgi:putative acetyltransferase
MPDDLLVRTSLTADRHAIVGVVHAAFSSPEHNGREEVDIVISTWEANAATVDLELVAVAEESIVGHVLGAWGDLAGRAVVAVAPLAVSPSHQGIGIGSALMHELVRRAEIAAIPLIAVLGDPDFYQRFGFEPAGPLGIDYPVVGVGNPHFQVRRFENYDASYRGSYTYCWEDSI